ncbi:unnamed protein product, partial [Effrenium voratum]
HMARLEVFLWVLCFRWCSAHRLLSDVGLSRSSNSCGSLSLSLTSVKASQNQCSLCVAMEGCKWCPLEHMCVARGLFSGHSCKQRPDQTEDAKIIADWPCQQRRPVWAQIMDEAFGAGWDATWRSQARHMDTVRCMQWKMGLAVTKDKHHTGDEETGRWGCISALFREGMLGALREKILQDSLEEDSDEDLSVRGGSLLQVNASQNQSQQRPQWYYDRSTWRPRVCEVFEHLHDEKCYVRAWKLRLFEQMHGVYGRERRQRLLASVNSGPMVPLSPGTGHSGSNFGCFGDCEFKVKLGLKYGLQVNEPNNLMGLVDNKDDSLLQHQTRHPKSLINRVWGMMKLAFGSYRSYSIVMDDAFFNLGIEATQAKTRHPALSFTRYDLKGRSRNQDARAPEGSFCLSNGDFDEREHGKLNLSPMQCLELRSALSADFQFLQRHEMIDYSLMILAVHKHSSEDLHCQREGRNVSEPECLESGKALYTASIIDYLNEFNVAKHVESIPSSKFYNYDRKMIDFVDKICPSGGVPSGSHRAGGAEDEFHTAPMSLK